MFVAEKFYPRPMSLRHPIDKVAWLSHVRRAFTSFLFLHIIGFSHHTLWMAFQPQADVMRTAGYNCDTVRRLLLLGSINVNMEGA